MTGSRQKLRKTSHVPGAVFRHALLYGLGPASSHGADDRRSRAPDHPTLSGRADRQPQLEGIRWRSRHHGLSADAACLLEREGVEGKVTRAVYIDQGNVSALQVICNNESALHAVGFVTLIAAKSNTLPTFSKLRDGSCVGGFWLDREGRPALYVTITIDPNVGEPVSAVTIVEPVQMTQGYAAGSKTTTP